MPYIASTMASNVDYVDYADSSSKGSPSIRKRHVTILGGSGVAKRTDSGGVLTSQGVITHVSDDELAFLESNETFKTHQKHGHVKVMLMDVKPEKAVKDMALKEASAPLDDSDFKEGGRAKMASDMAVSSAKIK